MYLGDAQPSPNDSAPSVVISQVGEDGKIIQYSAVYDDVDGDVVVGGDMVMGKVDDLLGDNEVSTSLFHYGDGLWPNGRLSYWLNSTFSQSQKDRVRGLIANFNAKMVAANIKINLEEVSESSERTKVEFTIMDEEDNVCGRAHVGYRSGVDRKIWLSKNCLTQRTTFHEILHALAIKHEHQRPDRDQYVDVNLEDAPENLKRAYAKLTDLSRTNYLTEYDTSSIMHYYMGKVLQPKPGVPPQVSNDRLTDMDLMGLQKLYGRAESSPTRLPSSSIVSNTFSSGEAKIFEADGLPWKIVGSTHCRLRSWTGIDKGKLVAPPTSSLRYDNYCN